MQDVQDELKAGNGEAVAFREAFERLGRSVQFNEAIVVSTLPRGGLQIVQPPQLSDNLFRSYSRDLEAHDSLSWQVISQGRAIRTTDGWPEGQFETGRFYREFMQGNGLVYAAGVPLTAPVLNGYPGALHVYRDAAKGDFSQQEIDQLVDFARELDRLIADVRRARGGESSTEPLPHDVPVRQFIFDRDLNTPVPQAAPSSLDERLVEAMQQDARTRLEHVNGREVESDRVSLADSRGDLWNFRVVVRRSYPALSEGPVIFYCLQPSCNDWSTLRPSDFEADQEVARLIPALKFMSAEFHRGPTLVEIAKTVHLSPFHFHRRFTELLGITPKHFLLDCQIQQAKSELLAREKDLAKIATHCGFAHQSHFTSRFKQATGLTPTRWRRMATEAQRVSSN